MTSCLEALGVPYRKDVGHRPDGTLSFRNDNMWDTAVWHPLPAWKPPCRVDDPDLTVEEIELLWPRGGIETDKEQVLDASRALGGSPNVLALYRGFKNQIERLSQVGKQAATKSYKDEISARGCTAVLGQEKLVIQTQTHTSLPPVMPSNAMLCGKYNPIVTYSDDPGSAAFIQKWILNLTVTARLSKSPPDFPDPAMPTEAEILTEYDNIADTFGEILQTLRDGKDVPHEIAPAQVR
jgi:hypothetical protein